MGSLPEQSLDHAKPRSSYSMLLKSFRPENTETTSDHTQKLQEFLSRLEEERLKIEAFKRELPLCMHLLNNAVEVYSQQLQSYRANGNNNHNQGAKPVLEEFIPIKNLNTDNNQEKKSDKANWMTSAQLWSQTTAVAANLSGNSVGETKSNVLSLSVKEITDITLTGSQLGLDNVNQRNGGAFLPFSKERSLIPELALSNLSDDPKDIMEDIKKGENGDTGRGENGNFGNGTNSNGSTSTTSTTTMTNPTHRKTRRCWSPDLHRRFVSALQLLGGSQVATPKQIRELMKVDGLTNDEVKSHLQKYRLHTRRPSPSPQASGGPAPQLVVLGGIWVPPEYAAHHGGATTFYHHHHHHSMAAAAAAHHPPSHFCGPQPAMTSLPQDFYTTAAAPTLPPPLHQQHHQFRQYTTVAASPEGTSGDRDRQGTENVEEGKSESGSWKAGGESSVGGGERKGLAALKEEGEESNGSEITLKF